MTDLKRGETRLCVFPISKRRALLSIGVLMGLAIAAGFSSQAKAQSQKRMDVLELFTSQGCSSCPPADALLQKFAERENIVALSFPVSYWDHLGWKDTLAKEAYNARQYRYAQVRGDRKVYTPQLIVNGVTHVIGSRRAAIDSALQETRQLLQRATVPVSVKQVGNKLDVEVGATPEGSDRRSARLWVACYQKSVDVAIGRGENTGRKITYTNVVREWLPAGEWTGSSARYDVAIPQDASFDGIAVLLQADDSHAMLGAAVIPFHNE